MNNKGKHEVLIGIIIGLGSGFLFTVLAGFLILLFMVKADEKKKKEPRTEAKTEEASEFLDDDDGGEGGVEYTDSGNYPAAGTYIFMGYGEEYSTGGVYSETMNTYYKEYTNDQGMELGDDINIFDDMVDNGWVISFTFNGDNTGSYMDRFDKAPSDVTLENGCVKFKKEKRTYGFDEDTFWYDGADRKTYIFEMVDPQIAENIRNGYGMTVPINEAKVGDMIAMGTYEQNHDTTDGMEPIVWDVLAVENGKMLVISDKVLDSYCFNNTDGAEQSPSMNWQDCSLRAFLNGDFINTCFTDEERAKIQTTHLSNLSNADFLRQYWSGLEAPYNELEQQTRTDDPETDDKVFVLSADEIVKYMGDEDDYRPDDEYPFSRFVGASGRTAKITNSIRYAGNVYYDRQTCESSWITRTLSAPHTDVVYITSNGSFFCWYSYSVGLGLRPAMWISVE